jgi:arylsulfatase A-like enzyme
VADQRPNFILVMPDQFRGDSLSLENHPVVMTPNIDHIGASGSHFRRAYSTCPSCVPARRSLMTGTFPATNGMVGFEEDVEWEAPPTLPEVLSDAGYHTSIVGRNMHLYPLRRRYGFDEMVIYPDDYREYVGDNQGDPAGVMDHGISRNGWTARPWHLEEKFHSTNWTVTEAERFLRRRDPSVPFFLTISLLAPHPPFVPPAFYFDRYLRQALPEPSIGDWAVPPPNDGIGQHPQADQVHLTGEALRSAQAGYFGLINHIDDQLARLFAGNPNGLDQATLDNTYIIFTSDHGEMLGDHYLFRKTYPYEGSARIPYLISGPGIESGRVCDQPVCLEDLMPTILDLAGCDIPPSVDGMSLAPFLRGETDTLGREFIHGEHATSYREEQANHYMTDGTYKYVWMSKSGDEQLFDLDEDPGERHNLAVGTDHDDMLAVWRSRLIDRLRERPEGFTDGTRLIAGRPHNATLPHVHGTGR